ncbi:MAG: metallophosphoesterase family protein [Candidatus Omnitrophica bacterium]|nr:metallophosphoesterase family protein [Candidatus Omnitrophota bacterium]
MKIGVISDTHIPIRATEIPKQILNEFSQVDLVLHSGDLETLSVLDSLSKVCSRVEAVYGNMDPLEVRRLLPQKRIIEVGKIRIGMTHGSGPAKGLVFTVEQIFKGDNLNIIIFGHSHSPLNEKRGSVLFFNPGSATDKIFSPFNSYGIIEIVNDKIEAKIIRL